LHPSIIDIRSWLWYNYGTELPQYKASVRYTSYLDASLGTGLSSSRRQEINYARRDGVETIGKFQLEAFLKLYAKYDYHKTKNHLPSYRQSEIRMRNLLESLFGVGHIEMFASYTKQGEIGSMAVFGMDSKRAYYLFGVNDPDLRNKHTGSIVLWDAFDRLKASEIDMEGINSPHRGWFKLSFGGDIRPYYWLSLEQ